MWHQKVAVVGGLGVGGGGWVHTLGTAMLLVCSTPLVREAGVSTSGSTAATNNNIRGQYDQTVSFMYSCSGQGGAPCDFSCVLHIALGLFCIQQVT